jgi:hypothetical protein
MTEDQKGLLALGLLCASLGIIAWRMTVHFDDVRADGCRKFCNPARVVFCAEPGQLCADGKYWVRP